MSASLLFLAFLSTLVVLVLIARTCMGFEYMVSRPGQALV